MAATATDDVVTVYRTSDPLDAHALAAQLVDEGIDAHVVGDFLNGGLGLTVGNTSQAEVWVPTPDRRAAAALVTQWRPALPPPPPMKGFRFSMWTAMVAMTFACFGMLLMTWGFNLLAIFEILLGWTAILTVVRRWIAGSGSDAEVDPDRRIGDTP